MEFLFWFLAGLVLYTYAGYSVLLAVWARFAEKPVVRGVEEPSVSVIMSVFNEEKNIREKLLALLDSDYPAEKLEILVGSDGGADETDQIISELHDRRIRFFRFVKNLGKPHVLNGLVHEAHGSVLVFTDARQRFEPGAIRELVSNFHDPQVGCVSGELHFEESRGSGVAAAMGAYWKYEKYLRKQESRIDSMLGATGAIYAIRRRLFEPVPHEILVDDMYVPLSVIQRGYRAVFDGEARAYDVVSTQGSQEFRRKVRTLAGNFQIFAAFPDLLNPLRSRVAWQLISHKLLRLVVPWALAGILGLNLALSGRGFYGIFLILQVVFYGLACWEWIHEKRFPGKRSLGYIPHLFCVLNVAAAAGLLQFLSGDIRGVWKKAYN